MKNSLFLSIFIFLTGCGASSHVLVGAQRPPIDPEQVQVYMQVPPGAQQVAILEASSIGSGPTNQMKTNKVMKRLKAEAAALGANGILLQGIGNEYGGSVGTMTGFGGSGSFTATGVGVPVMNKQGTAVAIYVEPTARLAPASSTPLPAPQAATPDPATPELDPGKRCDACKRIGKP